MGRSRSIRRSVSLGARGLGQGTATPLLLGPRETTLVGNGPLGFGGRVRLEMTEKITLEDVDGIWSVLGVVAEHPHQHIDLIGRKILAYFGVRVDQSPAPRRGHLPILLLSVFHEVMKHLPHLGLFNAWPVGIRWCT